MYLSLQKNENKNKNPTITPPKQMQTLLFYRLSMPKPFVDPNY